jgi:hypothetical protein
VCVRACVCVCVCVCACVRACVTTTANNRLTTNTEERSERRTETRGTRPVALKRMSCRPRATRRLLDPPAYPRSPAGSKTSESKVKAVIQNKSLFETKQKSVRRDARSRFSQAHHNIWQDNAEEKGRGSVLRASTHTRASVELKRKSRARASPHNKSDTDSEWESSACELIQQE